MPTAQIQSKPPFYLIFLLILAGEAIFILPFVLVRIFRPTFLSLYQYDNLDLGYCFSVYGIVAMVSYLIGGYLADRFKPGKMMGVALLLTALGGIPYALYPTIGLMKVLYAYWGCTTILLFWSAMIKSARIWGGQDRQGKAFGFLDGGRGLVAAGFGSVGMWILLFFSLEDFDTLSFIEQRIAFSNMVYFISGIIGFIGVLVFFFLDYTSSYQASNQKQKIEFSDIKALLSRPTIWAIMIIILTGYAGYKVTDIFSLYAADVMLYDEMASAKIGTLLLYVRPILGIIVGIMADRSKPSNYLLFGFGIMTIGCGIMASGILGPSLLLHFNISILTVAIGVYSIRSLYFAILPEGKIPLALTGTAVGMASFIGYTPDVFMGPIQGVLLDNFPGELGHQYVFGFQLALSIIGLLACIWFKWHSSKSVDDSNITYN